MVRHQSRWMALAGGQETAMLPCAVPGPSYPYPCHAQCRETDPSCHDRVHALDLVLPHTASCESMLHKDITLYDTTHGISPIADSRGRRVMVHR